MDRIDGNGAAFLREIAGIKKWIIGRLHAAGFGDMLEAELIIFSAIGALLIFQTPELPAALPELSPWVDAPRTTRHEFYAKLAAQEHRRFIKTHLQLRDVPIDSRVSYIIVARHPLDSAVSLYHVLRARAGQEVSGSDANEQQLRQQMPSPQEALRTFIDSDFRAGTKGGFEGPA
jgi:hypothetical protein